MIVNNCLWNNDLLYVKAFGLESDLVGHISRTHVTVKEFKCEKCSDRFGSQKLLNHHIKKSHNKTRPLECSTCFKTFNVQKALNQHIEKEHEKKNCENCQYCGKHFKKLKVHLEICNDRYADNERPMVKCSFCGRTLSSKDSVRNHVRYWCKKRFPEESKS